jgi:pimeloyl-ACP methyl ester carboxylesterase
MDLVQLSPGQQLLLALPDEVLPEDAFSPEVLGAGMAYTFGPDTQPDEEELAAQWELLARAGGNRLLSRQIRYIEERRVHEPRWTGAIERHPSPLTVVWGDADPIAVFPMAERLAATRADANLIRLSGIGHYPMIEAPREVSQAIAGALA